MQQGMRTWAGRVAHGDPGAPVGGHRADAGPPLPLHAAAPAAAAAGAAHLLAAQAAAAARVADATDTAAAAYYKGCRESSVISSVILVPFGGLLPTAPEDAGIAPLEADDAFSRACMAEKQGVGLILLHRVTAGCLSRVDALRR